jgi:tetratricopeptide (TPR) repeat protein
VKRRETKDSQPGTAARQNHVRVAVAGIILTLAAFGPAIRAPFDFDDRGTVIENWTIQRVWPPTALIQTPGLGTAASGRPVANYTFALNVALNRALGTTNGPNQTTGYHVVNILLHLLSALLIYVLIRDTLRFGRVGDEWRDRAETLATAVSAIWLLHPIQTEAVNYISQRTELLVSFFYLATLFGAQRAFREQGSRWSVFAIAASLLGMASKEVMLTAPVMVVLYDRAFLFPRWASSWQSRRRRWLYAGLFATSVVSLILIARGGRGGTVGFDVGIPWYQYLYDQGAIIPRYVQLLFWPDRLSYDYGPNWVAGGEAIAGLAALIATGVATIIAWKTDRMRPLGFVGAWFFVILAPSSSIIPIRTEIGAERRIYLASAAVIALATILVMYAQSRRPRTTMATIFTIYFVASGWTAARLAPRELSLQLLARFGIATAVAVIAWCILSRRRWLQVTAACLVPALLVARAASRSTLYRDPEALWRNAVSIVPTNGRGYNALAGFRLHSYPPHLREADSLFLKASELDTMLVQPWLGRAAIATKEDRLADAESLLRHVLRLSPGDSSASDQLGRVLLATGRSDQAIPYLKRLADRWPTGETFSNLGVAYLTLGRLDSARETLDRALGLDSLNVGALGYLGATLVELGRGSDAIPYLTRAVELESAPGFTTGVLAVAYAQAGKPELARKAASMAVDREPRSSIVRVFAGRALALGGFKREAAAYFRDAVRLDPGDAQALTRLANVLASLGEKVEAARFLNQALSIAPNDSAARQSLARLRGR